MTGAAAGLGLRERRRDDLTGRAAVLDGDGLDRRGLRERERAGVERAVGRRVAAVGRVVDERRPPSVSQVMVTRRLLTDEGAAFRIDDRSGRRLRRSERRRIALADGLCRRAPSSSIGELWLRAPRCQSRKCPEQALYAAPCPRTGCR